MKRAAVCSLVAFAAAGAALRVSACEPPACAPMVPIPAGEFRPFFKTKSAIRSVAVAPFELDALPVSRGQFLVFVREHRQWRRSAVRELFAESTYLADWPDDLHAGPRDADKPVTFVSWFAARAYCASAGGRLPALAEWERAAGHALRVVPASTASIEHGRSPFAFAMGRPADDLENTALEFEEIWEWTEDFDAAPVASPSVNRSATASSLFCGDGYRSNEPMDYAAFLRYSFRSSLRASYALKNLGFRCAYSSS
jgi:formylglycine-generating enzyme required for sulfatase activity